MGQTESMGGEKQRKDDQKEKKNKHFNFRM